MNEVIIYVEGGVVQGVMTNEHPNNISVEVFDVDNLKEKLTKKQISKNWEKLTKGMEVIY